MIVGWWRFIISNPTDALWRPEIGDHIIGAGAKGKPKEKKKVNHCGFKSIEREPQNISRLRIYNHSKPPCRKIYVVPLITIICLLPLHG